MALETASELATETTHVDAPAQLAPNPITRFLSSYLVLKGVVSQGHELEVELIVLSQMKDGVRNGEGVTKIEDGTRRFAFCDRTVNYVVI